ncbi:MAG: cytochrome c [Chloroflexota bacterium]
MLKNKNGKFKKQIPLLLVMVLMSLLVGCGSTPEDVTPVETPSAEAIAGGDVENGRKLFMGYAHFEHEGPPCMGCHSVGENGILGGGALGPNLTNISAERSDDEIIGVLSNTGTVISPVMKPIYETDPLTAQEQADLLAFMKASVGEPETDRELLVFGISILGTVGAAIMFGFIYRNRLRSVRRALVNKAQKELL